MAEIIKLGKKDKIGAPLYEVESTPQGRRRLERSEDTLISDFDLMTNGQGKTTQKRDVRKTN